MLLQGDQLSRMKISGYKSIKDCDLDFGRINVLIGSNGAGKTSLLKAISGMVEHTGVVEWNGENISSYNSVSIAKRGV